MGRLGVDDGRTRLVNLRLLVRFLSPKLTSFVCRGRARFRRRAVSPSCVVYSLDVAIALLVVFCRCRAQDTGIALRSAFAASHTPAEPRIELGSIRQPVEGHEVRQGPTTQKSRPGMPMARSHMPRHSASWVGVNKSCNTRPRVFVVAA